MDDVHQKTLLCQDPNVDTSLVQFNFKLQEFELREMKMAECELYNFEGNVMHVHASEPDVGTYFIVGGNGECEPSDVCPTPLETTGEEEDEENPENKNDEEGKEPKEKSDEEGKEEEREGTTEQEEEEEEEEAGDKDEDENDESAEKSDKGTEGSVQGRTEDSEEDGMKKKKSKKKLPNQFNFSDRGALTYSVITRNATSQTVPPPTAVCEGQFSQWIIYDEYQKDYANLMAAKEKEKKERQILSRHDATNASEKADHMNSEGSYIIRLFQAVKIMERMVTQNTFEDIAFDCQFYDDPADKFREKEGALLPLWDFMNEECENVIVTDIKWSPRYYDLFAASFGTYNFNSLKLNGLVCMYSLKNPSHPEFKIKFSTGAQTVDIHPKEPYYIAIGLYNGSVAVVNVKDGKNLSTMESGLWKKHNGVVWEVRWCDDPRDRQLGFYSAASDGKIFKWLVQAQDLTMIPVITLILEDELGGTPVDSTGIPLTATANCIAFEPDNYEIFLVGTAEGLIYKCSISYSCSYLYIYKAHDLPVYRISYNTFVTHIFASCSSDWRIKIWEDLQPSPLYVFDLLCPIGDVEWAPYSSTVLAAVTTDGKINIFDLNVDKHQPICVQTVCYPDNGFSTRLSFNKRLPVILVGDSTGYLLSLKISPNCRIPTKATKKNVWIDPKQLELMKLERVLSFVRDPAALNGGIADMFNLESKDKLKE